MLFRFKNSKLKRLWADPGYDAGFNGDVVKTFRKRVAFIDAAGDERDFYAMKSLHFEKLRGKRSHLRSMRLNKQWRLIIEFEKDARGKIVVIISIEDYH